MIHPGSAHLGAETIDIYAKKLTYFSSKCDEFLEAECELD